MPQPDVPSLRRPHRHENDTTICLDLINRGISHMKAVYLVRYRDLFQAVRTKVYADTTSMNASTDGSPTRPMNAPSVELYSTSEGLDFGGEDTMMHPAGEGMETYLSQVNDFLEGGMMDMDETLNVWYESMVQELQDNQVQDFL